MTDWKSSWIKGGKISHITWINDEIIAWCSGIHIVFFNIINCKETIFSSSYFDGTCCITGNLKVNIFAFAEKCERPRILVYSYPQLTLISECLKGTEHAYLAIDLTSSDYLVSLGSYPTYLLVIWKWKSGEQLFSIETPINDIQGQIIRVSDSKIKLIAQLAKHSGKLVVWEIITTLTLTMSQQEILLPAGASPVYIDWSLKNDIPQLAIVDKNGHVYLTNKNGDEIKQIIFSQRCAVCFNYELPIICWFQDGIILKTTFCQLRFYKKNNQNIWKKEQCFKSNLKPYILSPHPFNKNKLLYLTIEGFLMEMNLSDGVNALKTEEKFNYGGIYNLVDLVYPLGQHLVVIDYSLGLSIKDVMDGKEISKLNMEMEGQVSNLVSHPDYPIVAIITTSGELNLFNIVSNNIHLIIKYRLQNYQLDIIKFSQCGKHLIVAKKLSHICYCIISDKRNSFSKIYQVKTKIQIIDFLLFEVKGIFNLFLLALSSSKAIVGNFIVIFTLSPSDEMFKQSHIKYLPTIYQCINYSVINPSILITTPYLSRQIQYLNIEVGSKINLIDAKMMNNQLRNLKIHTNRYCFTVSGYDGLITIFEDEDYSSTATLSLSSHHRKDLGTSKAICIPSKGLLIALGRNGSIVCMKSEENLKKKLFKSDYLYTTSSIYNKLLGRCKIIPPDEDKLKKTWVEWEEEKQLNKEEKAFRENRLNIKKDFNIIKNKIKKMLDDNESLLEKEKFPLSVFDLASYVREEKIKASKEERKDLRLKLEFECFSMNKVSNWIKIKFWNSQKILNKSLLSIMGNTEVMNFPLIIENPQEEQMNFWLEYFENTIKSRMSFSSEKSGHFLLVRNKYNPSCQDEKSVIETLMIDDKEYEDEEEKKKEQQASSGTTTYKFVEPLSQYSQYQDYSFSEFILITKNIIHDIERLKNYFNQIFEQVYQLKQEAMILIIEKNAKIRQIDLEMKLMFNQSVPELFPDPQWHWKEQPGSLIEISNDEIMEKNFFSNLQQNFVDQQAGEETGKMQLLILSKDFREKMLMEMMDGVLEVRWEDVIKKDITKPLCMLTKMPEEYTAEDMLVIKQYEKNVHALIQEREKYKRILKNDFEKIMKIIKDKINKFNSCLHDLLVKRMKVESAIQQLNLLRAREYIRVICKMKMCKNMQDIEKKINSKEKMIEITNQMNYSLQRLLPELKNQREILIEKDKFFLKTFYNEFRSIGKHNQEILKKFYKKRPKISLKNFTTGELIELGKYLIGCGNIKYLFDNLLEYSKVLNSYDLQPPDLPDSITSYYWNRLVTIRRNKINIELNLKANLKEINEIEESMNDNKKKIKFYKEDIGNLDDQLIQLEKDLIEFESNIEIQLVLKLGQVEVNLKGQRNEAETSIFVTRKDVEKINDKIITVGNEKLKAMKKEISLHKNIIIKEWKHKFLIIKLKYYQNELHDIENFFLTKNIKDCLTTDLIENKDNLINQQLEKNTEVVRNNLKKIYDNELQMLNEIKVKIKLKKKENQELDKIIVEMNLKNLEIELKKNLEDEERIKKFYDKKFKLAVKRSKLVRNIQEEYCDVLALKEEYQSLHIIKYPFIYLS